MDTTVIEYRGSTTSKCVEAVLRAVNTETSRSVLSALQKGDYTHALGIPFPEPSQYSCANSFARDYLVYNLIRKSDFLDLGIDKKAAAIASFHVSEATCRTINSLGRDPSVIDTNPLDRSFEAVLHTAKVKIRNALGCFSWDKAAREFGFSGGASTRLPKKSGAPFYKYQGKPEVTPGAKLLALCDIWRTPLWRDQICTPRHDPDLWVKMIAGSRADTVPKTWKTDRFICIEPDLNMRMQRGIGKLIRRALKRVGINLDDQSLNQYLAWIGSRTGSLATIDLSRASDSVAIALVELLLPPDWVEAMHLTRSHYTFLEGKWVKLEKISSMGNGFTFELESLIFWALASSVIELHQVEDQRLAVYGDDIVCHHEAARPLIDVLSYVGFETNKEKTFIEGPFRESCGKHYFYGVDVTPFYVQEAIESEDRYYWFLNSFRSWLERGHTGGGLAPHHRIFNYLRRKVKGGFCIVPPGYGFTAGIETPISSARVYYSLGRQQYLFKALRPVRRKHRPNGYAAVLAWLSSAGKEPSENRMFIEKGDIVYKRFNRGTSRWD